MKIQSCLYLALCLAFSGPVFADEKAVIGVQTYKTVCAACHDSGVANAPKFGDKNVWKPLIDEGQVVITAHGYVGVRAMPPKGGKADLSVEHFAEALNYMVNNSGGQWSSPDKPMLAKIHDEIADRKKNIK
jgi:cytochrome c5